MYRSKAEEDAWLEISHRYNTYRADILAGLAKLSSAKGKGKQRASDEMLDQWGGDDSALPQDFRGSGNVDLARSVVSSEVDKKNPLSSRLGDVEHMVSQKYLPLYP